jgi:hypothetical protein
MNKREYGTSLTGDFLNLAHRICEQEFDVTLPRESEIQWESYPGAFNGSLILAPLNLEFTDDDKAFVVDDFMLYLDNGEGETAIHVWRGIENNLDRDPFAAWILEQANVIFDSHDHQVCEKMSPYKPKDNQTKLSTLRSAATGEVLVF